MAKKSKKVKGQLSFFDIIPIMQETQTQLRVVNDKENKTLEEALYGTGQQDGRPRDNISVSTRGSNHDDTQVPQSIPLQDNSKMGDEQSREADSPIQSGGSNRPHREDEQAIQHGGRGTLFGYGGRPTPRGLQQMGNSPSTRSEHRTLENYTITASDNLGKGNANEKFKDNIKAIKTLHQIRAEDRSATVDEQKILVKYVGWGGLSQVFDNTNSVWSKEYEQLKSLLSDLEYTNARRSTQDAHFTSETIIKGMYEGFKHIGVSHTEKPLKILEPSVGIGNFIGLQPKELNASFYAIEQDTLTSEIAKQLYPKANHKNIGFQDTEYARDLFDITIGNPPFGNQSLHDRNFPELSGYSIHNYFIAKSMSLLKEGGVGAFVVSRYFLDSQSLSHRSHIAFDNHFLGAVRLPSNAFNENALTTVTTDIVFFQKKTALEKEQGIEKGYTEWRSLGDTECHNKRLDELQTAKINQYYIDNPQQILGEMKFVSGQFADELNCVPNADISTLGTRISQALQVLPKDVYSPTIADKAEDASTKAEVSREFLNSKYLLDLKQESFCEHNNILYSKKKDQYGDIFLEECVLKNRKEAERIKGMIGIRDTLRTLINLEKREDTTDSFIAEYRDRLNSKYDTFQRKFGYLNSQTNNKLFRDDPESSLIQSLEKNYDKGITKELAQKTGREAREASATKSDIFFKRILRPNIVKTHADTTKDALAICLGEKGIVDFERIASLVKKTEDDVQRELQNERLIFLNPASEEWEIKDKYLTGNVKEKLTIAQDYADNRSNIYQANVEALKEVIPMDIEAVDIGVRLGASWIPADDLLKFVDEEIGGLDNYSTNLEYVSVLGRWSAKISIYDNAVNTELWGTNDYPADKLIEAILTNKSIKVEREIGRDPNGRAIKELDQEATSVAMRKAKNIEQAFSDWIWRDDERRERLARVYNDRFNTHVVPKYDGSHIELVGASDAVSLRPHQKNAVWRAMQEGTALFDHVVGAGKTLAATAMVKESKRMGLFNKPMIVVPNHLVYQWRDEVYKLYPDANILVAKKEDFLKQNRERFFSRVATNDWDMVIVAHSSFKKIDMPKQIEQEILEEQISATASALAVLKATEGSKATVKQLEKQKERMQSRFAELIAGAGDKDKSVDFSDLGVDALIIDEAHEFKNLNIATTLSVSGLGNLTGSAKAFDLFIKCRYLQRENEGKGVYFLTGTPISNSISEVYTLQRYLQFDELCKKGLEFFDSWASTFGKINSDWELDATGVNYKLKSRFSKFDNVPELLSMYRTFADVVTKEDIDKQLSQVGLRSNTPSLLEGKPISHIVERSFYQAMYMDKIIYRMENLPSDPRKDNPLKITNDARKCGLDFRLIDPEASDVVETKVNACADRIYDIWQNTHEDKGTQLVFCDLSTPKKKDLQEVEMSSLVFADDEFKEDDDVQVKERSMDEILSAIDTSKFSVYNDLKLKLMERGIPHEEIAFIHDANTDQRKAKLFTEVKNGDVRVLLGSTAKMGAGMNVQDRLVAAHHLDAPWV